MSKGMLKICALVLSSGLLAFAGGANAQATRTWVSGVGDDANPCSRTAPCKTFAGAISKTAIGGEINCIDPGGFGGVTITKPISIKCDNVEAGVLVSGTNAIIISVASTDAVYLEGLDIYGMGTGLDGVKIINSGTVYIRDCTIQRFTGNAVNVVGNVGARVVIQDSRLLYNGGGLNVIGISNAANSAFMTNVTMDRQTNFAVKVGLNSTVVLDRTINAKTTVGWDTSLGGTIISAGNNINRGSGVATSTQPLQ